MSSDLHTHSTVCTYPHTHHIYTVINNIKIKNERKRWKKDEGKLGLLFACDLSTKEAEAKGGSLKGKASMVSPRPAWVLGEDLSKTITTTKERKSVWGRVQPRHLPREQGGKTLTVPCHKTVIEYSLD